MEGKAAILISGSSYNVKFSLPSFMKNLVEENDADVFIVTTRRCKRRKTPKSEIFDCDTDWENYRLKNAKTILDMQDLTDVEIQLIRDTFGDRLKVLEIAEESPQYWQSVLNGRQKMLDTVNSYIDTHPRCFNGIKINAPDKGTILYTSDQYHHVKRVYELFDAYSKQNNIKYDYVMRARIDFKCPFPFNMEHYLLNHDEQYLYSLGSFRRDPFAWADEFCWFSRTNMAKKLFPHLHKIGLITDTKGVNTIDGSNNDTIFSPECQYDLLLRELNLKVVNVRIYRSGEYTNDGQYDYFNYRFRRDKPVDINYEYKMVTDYPTDINEHCPTLYKLALECDSIVELGQRYSNSTVAFMKAAKEKNIPFISYDPQGNSRIQYVEMVAKENNVNYEFRLRLPYNEDKTETDIPECDLLFIDTNHHCQENELELRLHPKRVRKYIVMHDVFSQFWLQGQGFDQGGCGLVESVMPFLEKNKDTWRAKEWHKNNNGLLIMERIGN